MVISLIRNKLPIRIANIVLHDSNWLESTEVWDHMSDYPKYKDNYKAAVTDKLITRVSMIYN